MADWRPLVLAALAALAAVPAAASGSEPVIIPDAQIEPLAWADVTGWETDDHAAAFAAFQKSCGAILKRQKAQVESRPVPASLVRICRETLPRRRLTGAEMRIFFESHFRPVRISRIGDPEGFVTGYYEPVVEGSRVRTEEFTVPLYRKPDDLISAQPPTQSGGFSNRGQAFRKVGEELVPYYERGEIEDGALAGRDLEICWLRDPIDAFFIQIQGSARVRLDDGTVLRLNYDAHNGHPYTAIGRFLVEREIIPRDEMSMDKLRQWMRDNPELGKELRRQNKSYVFFRVATLGEHEEALGAQGIPLVTGRSIAIDRRLHAYGMPFWIDGELPVGTNGAKDRFRRLMIAHDTGSAIVGPARADIYFGTGSEAGRVAGRIRHPARFVMLVPKDVRLVQGPARIPYPRPRPVAAP